MFDIRLAAGAAVFVLFGGPALAVPVQWSAASGGNDHWYELVVSSGDWAAAVEGAATRTHLGQAGYLATVTSQAEMDFLVTSVNAGTQAWLGGADRGTEGQWIWETGPEAGQTFWSGAAAGTELIYANWNGGEPNDTSGNEDALVGWAAGTRWNDLPTTYTVGAYVVEHQPEAVAGAQVPLPAALPLMLGGLGGLALLRRRKG